ncbi:MAG: coproporphyrinogen dehydrogenase HemZ [Clostridia bacterium]|nr:coproporphyrinogen dehydrogenase HemZ [Clostridia bacterium]
MILHVDEAINASYVQTLCLVFFPGSKFGQNEIPSEDTPEMTVRILSRDDENVTAEAVLLYRQKVTCGTGSATANEDISRSQILKIAVGRAVFEAGKKYFGYMPPWGILTGVRSSKVAVEMLLNGKGIRRARQILRDEYFVNPKKASLAVSVASTEIKLTKKLPSNLCSVYVSIPFCPSRCAYCSFVSYTSAKLLSLIDDYLQTLYTDIKHLFALIRESGLSVATVYIGGGTPTVLSEKQLANLLAHITKEVDPASLMEFTLEAGRPDTITEGKLKIARKYGISRISVNPQTLNDDVLVSIGRKHTVEDFYRAYDIAVKSGIPDINVDLIAGLPGDDFSIFSDTIDRIIDLRPTNITVHTFSVKKAADLLRSEQNVYSMKGGDAAQCVEYSQLKTKLAGYKPYYMYRQKNTVGNLENVGYALDGAEGMYNIFMMGELHSIFAVGAGAVTKIVRHIHEDSAKQQIERIFMPKYPYEYLRDAELIRKGDPERGIPSFADKVKAALLKNEG